MNFFESFIGDYEMNVAGQIRPRILRMSRAQIETGLEPLKKGFQFGTVEVDWNGLVALPNVREVKSHRGGPFGVEEVSVPVYSFELPYKGDERLFRFYGDQHRSWTFDADVQDGVIQFEIQGADKTKLDSIRQNFTFNLEHLLKHIPHINEIVTNTVDNASQERLRQLESSQDGLSAFGVPVKGSE